MPLSLLSQPLSESFPWAAATLPIIVIYVLAGWIHKYVKNMRLDLPPGLWKLPFIGNLHQLVFIDRSRKGECEQFHEWCEKLGSFFPFTLFLNFRGSFESRCILMAQLQGQIYYHWTLPAVA
jgi:hypothetical protein